MNLEDKSNEINENELNIALAVDLDGTLIAGDTLFESCLIAVKKHPWLLLLMPFWILKGKLFFKENVHRFAEPDYETLMYHDEVIEFIEQEKSKGRQIILATASSQVIADKIAEDLGIFDIVLGSGDGTNLRSSFKATELVKRFGTKGFDYMGDSSADINVFKSARYAYLVEPKSSVRKKTEEIGNLKQVFGEKQSKIKLIIKEIRVYQWVKNLLVFLPMLLAHILPEGNYLASTLIAFLSFSFTASSVYVLNDMLDLSADRKHSRKRNRPFASGKLSLKYGFVLFPLLLIGGFLPAILFLPLSFLILLTSYLIITTLYSFILKRIYIIDILVLAGLYTLRLIGGALAVDVEASPWLLAFSMFIFLSLACVKRFTELNDLLSKNKEKTSGRGYFTNDISLIQNIGTSSGLLSILVFVLYVNSKEVLSLYSNPYLLYLVGLLLLYWILRIWFKAGRGEMHDDPIVFTGRDSASLVTFFIIFLLVLGATL